MAARSLATVALIAATLAVQGCVAAGVTMLGAGAGIAGGTGLNYGLDSVVYKTFTVPEAELRQATVRSLKRMAIDVTETQRTEDGSQITAVAGDRTVDIELDRITAKTTRMRVNVKKGWLLRDRATATEIILQTDHTLEHEPAATRSARRHTP
jgi:hypothetical protein